MDWREALRLAALMAVRRMTTLFSILITLLAAFTAHAETPCEQQVNETLAFMGQPAIQSGVYTLPPVATHIGYGRLAYANRQYIAANYRIARAGLLQALQESTKEKFESIRLEVLKAHDGIVQETDFDLLSYVKTAPAHALRMMADMASVSNETYDAIRVLETYQGPKIASRLRSDVTIELRSYPMVTVTGPWRTREIGLRATIDLQTCAFVSDKGTRHLTLNQMLESDYACRWPNFRSGYPKGCRALHE